MADKISSKRRSEIMSHIKSENTSIELLVRRYLFSQGYRYRVNYKELPGKPDIVFTKKKVVIFIHGCFWHGHECGSRYAHTSQSNQNYWMPKIQRTIERDKEHESLLKENGWKVIILWECQIKDHFQTVMKTVTDNLSQSD